MKGLIKITICLTFIFTAIVASSQTRITWNSLKDVKFADKWSDEYQAYYSIPEFGKQIKKLDGKKVIIRGYIIPLDVVAGYYVLSANPYSSCFFCGQAGPESVIEIQLKKQYDNLRMDQIVTFEGLLRLNPDDINQLVYILEKAELVEQPEEN